MSLETFRRQLLAELRGNLRILPDKPEENAANTLAALWLAAAGQPRSAVAAAGAKLPPLSAGGRERLRILLARRLAGEPLAHITGRQEFMGIELFSGKEALIPRKETEILGQAAVGVLRKLEDEGRQIQVMDVCTGAGNLAIVLALNSPGSRVYCADLSEDAVALARRNGELHRVTDRMDYRTGDLFAPFDHETFYGSMDLVTCNPPYISTARVTEMEAEISTHEPYLAFDGGAFGITILHRFLQEVPRFLKPDGWLAFEVGLGQGRAICRRMEKKYGFREITPQRDAQGEIRCIVARNRG